MATLNTAVAAVELPTSRHSQVGFPDVDIYNPNWIPVLSGPTLTKSNSIAGFTGSHYFDPLSVDLILSRTLSQPQLPREALKMTRKRSQSSLAPELRPESPPQELEANPSPHMSAAIAQLYLKAGIPLPHLRHLPRRHSDDEQNSDNTASTGVPSTIGTVSAMEDQVYTIPGNSMPKDDLVFPPVPLSARSSVASSRKSAIPTSKYSRKPLPAGNNASSAPPSSQPQTPGESPRSTHASLVVGLSELPTALPQLPEPIAQTATQRIQHMKSTASERKARALHSHPSNQSLTQPLPSPAECSELNRPSTARSRKSVDSARAMRPSVRDSHQPSAAPTLPLPELPPIAKRSSTRERISIQPDVSPIISPVTPTMGSSNSPAVARVNGHTEMAGFMTLTNTIVFRRFDEVHVRLLLSLQDEIGALEKELLSLEQTGQRGIEIDNRKIKTLGELRRLLAEYDHLFANWNLMQASKANQKTREELEKWLERPSTRAGATLSPSAKQDLEWLQSTKDLSSVQLGANKVNHSFSNDGSDSKESSEVMGSTTNEKTSSKSMRSQQDPSSRGGISSLFGACVGRRK